MSRDLDAVKTAFHMLMATAAMVLQCPYTREVACIGKRKSIYIHYTVNVNGQGRCKLYRVYRNWIHITIHSIHTRRYIALRSVNVHVGLYYI